ncbi:MAG TPA: hypothetical protein VNQ77_00145 [Frankiaceae bacterium]|nr:hypothetical protein [Frankiaceae bacterium]
MMRTLSLKRETLSELTSADLVAVVGGAYDMTRVGMTCPIARCADSDLSDILGCLPTADGCATNNC